MKNTETQLAPFVTVKSNRSPFYRCTVDIRTEEGRKVLELVKRVHRSVNPGKQIKARGRLGRNNQNANRYAQGADLHRYTSQDIKIEHAAYADIYVYNRK